MTKSVRLTEHCISWICNQMETFPALLALCAGISSVTGEFPSQRLVMRSSDVFFDLRLNKQLSKQSWGWWFETPSRSLWPHCNVSLNVQIDMSLDQHDKGDLLKCISNIFIQCLTNQWNYSILEPCLKHKVLPHYIKRQIAYHIKQKSFHERFDRLFLNIIQKTFCTKPWE